MMHLLLEFESRRQETIQPIRDVCNQLFSGHTQSSGRKVDFDPKPSKSLKEELAEYPSLVKAVMAELCEISPPLGELVHLRTTGAVQSHMANSVPDDEIAAPPSDPALCDLIATP